MFGPLLDVRMSCRVAGARDSAPCQKGAKREGFAALPKTMAAVGHLKGIWKDAFRVADAIQETALHSTSIFEEVTQNWFVFYVVTVRKLGSLAELLRFLLLSLRTDIEEVSQNCCVYDVVKFKKLRKSRRIGSFSSLQVDR